MAPFEPQHSFEHLDELCYKIGPRLAGSERSRKSAEYIGEKFEDYGLKTRFQNFEFVDRIKLLRARGLVLAGVFLASLFLDPPIALAAILAGFGVSYRIDLLLPGEEERNVVGTLEPDGGTEKRIIVGAHYDSATCTKSRKWSLVYRGTLPVLLAALLALAALRFLAGDWVWLAAMLTLAGPYLVTCLIPFWIYGDLVSPGADDNASGVSVMLEAARVAAENPPEGTEIRFVGIGAEEQGLVGSKVLSERSARPDIFLNLDALGGGSRLATVRGTGVLRKRPTSKELGEKLEEGGDLDGIWRPLAGYDHVPFVEKGVASVTLTSHEPGGEGRAGRLLERLFGLEDVRTRLNSNIHTLEDVPENIRLENIKRSGEAVLGLLGVEGKEDLSEEPD